MAETSRDKLIRVAIDLFSAKGFKGTSIRDIATAMNMSISTIYHYFGNKEGLWLAIMEYAAKGISTKLKEITALDMAPLARFKRLLETHLQQSKYHEKESKIFFIDEENLTAEGNAIKREMQREILDIYIAELRNLERLGIVKCRSVKILAFNILGVMNWHLHWYRPEGALSLEETAADVVSFLLHGAMGRSNLTDAQSVQPCVTLARAASGTD